MGVWREKERVGRMSSCFTSAFHSGCCDLGVSFGTNVNFTNVALCGRLGSFVKRVCGKM